MSLDLMDMWVSMGWFAKGIVGLLFLMSIFSLTVAFQKVMLIRKSQAATRKFAPEFSRAIQEGSLENAIRLAEKNKISHVSRVLGEALAEVKPLLSDQATVTVADINSAERAVERQMLIVLADYKRGLGVLGTVGSTAPFVGLLGTTMGIVNAFQGMSAGGASGGLAGISAGISEALITTAFGLIVAIPAVWFYNYFTTKIENLTIEMTVSSKELIDYLIKSVGNEFGRSIFTKEFQAQKAVSGSGHIHG
ncbi:MAG: MotA/TolQ/ExbB proton channel family protein [Gemmatimonadales bacterium]